MFRYQSCFQGLRMSANEHVKKFLSLAFSDTFTPAAPPSDEQQIIDSILSYVSGHISGVSRPRKYVLGLGLNFALLAQRLSLADASAIDFRPTLTVSELFARYSLITERGNTTANTLSLTFGGVQEGIRRLEEGVVELFHSLNRSGYPSAYVYNTGQWHKYKDLLVQCFRLSENGRYALCLSLIDYGCSIIPEHTFFGRSVPRVRLFEEVVKHYPRTSPNENGGLVLQGIAHGFIAADRPHLSIIADKVRTGSARQKRFGDIDGYRGLDLELSVEVKDIHITESNYSRELDGFAKQVEASSVLGIAFVQGIDDAPKSKLTDVGIVVLTLPEIVRTIETWDWPKQENALQVLLHHVAHIEQKTEATSRLLCFLQQLDPNHDSLIYLAP